MYFHCMFLMTFAIFSLVPQAVPLNIREVYSAKNELRCIGRTQPHGKFPGIDVFMKPIREYGYNAVVVSGLDDAWAALYPSKIFPFAHFRGYSSDTLQTIIDTCHAEGVKVIAYCPYQMLTNDPKYIDGMMEWEKKAPAWNPEKKSLASMDSPYRYLLAGALKELAAMGVDGFWIDGFTMESHNFAGIRNQYTDPIFKRETGFDPPMKEDWESEDFRHWVKWRYQRHIQNGKWLVEQVRLDQT